MSGVVKLVDLEALLKPIPGDLPCGENLHYSGLHDDIRQARRSDADNGLGEVKEADWERIIGLSTEALASKTKDLQVAAWLGEALVKRHGFAGLSDSLKLMVGMLTNFWDTFYPEIEEDDMEARANTMSWYDRRVSFAAREVPLTSAPRSDNFSYFRWQQASLPEEYQQIALNNPLEAESIKERCDRNAEEWTRLSIATPRKFYEDTAALLRQCWAAYTELDHLMDEKFGKQQTPGLGELEKALRAIQGIVDRFAGEKSELGLGSNNNADSVSDPIEKNREKVMSTGAIDSRQDALKRLSDVAEYFQRTEPHSPVAYLIRRAIKWGNMPLDKLLQDIIKDASVLNHINDMLGFMNEAEKTNE